MRTTTKIYLIFALFVLSSCSKKYKYEYYDSGEIRKKIFLKENKIDTNKIYFYSKKQDIFLKQFYLPNNTIIQDLIKDTIDFLNYYSLTTDDTLPTFDKGVLVVRNGKNYGIQRLYNIKDSFKNIKVYMIDNKFMGYSFYQKETTKYYKYQGKILPNDKVYKEALLVYDFDNNLLEKECLGYIAVGKDTIPEGDDYNLKIEYKTGAFGLDSVLCGIDIGSMDSSYTINELTHSNGGYIEEDTFILRKPEVGYHFITGRIYYDVKDNEKQVILRREITFYHDFYVK